MAKLPVALVIVATSRNGSEAAKLLVAQGKYAVRLAARDPSKLADLLSEGAEAVALDARSLESMKEACTGVDVVYLVLPSLVQGAEVILFENLLQAAKATGVKHVVFMSSLDAEPPAGYTPFQPNYEREHALVGSGMATTILRPTFFHENVVANADSVKRTGEYYSSAGDGLWTTVAVRDIAAAAVAVLSDPEAHAGKVYKLTTEAVTEKQVAEKVSKVAGKKVTHVNMSAEEYGAVLKKIYPGPAAGAEEFAHGLVTLEEGKRKSLFSEVYPDLERLLGRKGVSLDDFLQENAAAFQT